MSKPKKVYSYREVEKVLNAHGWYAIRSSGSHYRFKHEETNKKLTVPKHDELKYGTLSGIFKKAGIEF